METQKTEIEKITVEDGLLKLEWDQFKRILEMIKSPDVGTQDLVISLLDQLDIEKNLPFVLMIIKYLTPRQRGDIDKKSDVLKKIKMYIPKNNGVYTFQDIYNIIKDRDDLDIDFFMNEMAEHLQNMLNGWGLNFSDKYKLKFEKV
jgi:hypothetical protein